MRKLLVKIDTKSAEAIPDLEKFGKIEKVSVLMNIFSIEGSNLSIAKIKKIEGVLTVEDDYSGELLMAL